MIAQTMQSYFIHSNLVMYVLRMKKKRAVRESLCMISIHVHYYKSIRMDIIYVFPSARHSSSDYAIHFVLIDMHVDI